MSVNGKVTTICKEDEIQGKFRVEDQILFEREREKETKKEI